MKHSSYRWSTFLALLPLVLLPAAVALPVAPVFAQATQTPQVTPKISEIIVLGNKELNKEGILSAAGLKVGDPARQEVLDSARIALLNTGNFGARSAEHPEDAVKIRTTDLNEARNEVKVVIEVQENDVVQGFNIMGTGPIPAKDVVAQLQTKKGFVLNLNTLRQDVERIQKYYDSKGYLVTVSDEGFGITNGILDIPLLVGRIGTIKLNGLHKTRPWVVNREMKLKPGDYYSVLQLRKDYQALFNTGYFEDIQPTILTPKPGVVDLTLNFQEKRTGQVGLSVGYSSRGGVIGRAEIGENNFLGRGQQINLSLERSGLTNHTGFEVGFTEPWLDKKHTSITGSIYDRVVYRFGQSLSSVNNTTTIGNTDYYEIHTGGQITLSRPFSENVRGFVGLRHDNVRVPFLGQLNTNDAAILQNGPLTVLTLRGVYNTRDFDQDPAVGGLDQLSFDLGHADLKAVVPGTTGVFGSQNYQKYQTDVRRYFSPKGRRISAKDKRTTFAMRFMLGSSNGILPFSEQYFVGGAESLRGYNEDRFWGKNMVLGSFEFRSPLANALTGVLFADVGDAWGGNYEQVKFNGFTQHSGFSPSVGFGIGMRVVTPIGAIRIDEGFGREGAHTHFSIGHVF